MPKTIHFLINPAAGQPFPILNTINAVCAKYDCAWSVDVTQKDTVDALAQAAAQSNADIIAVYGGDGTVAAVAHYLIGTDKVLGILPGGTANVLATELGIPQNVEKACALVCGPKARTKAIDAGKVNDRHFLLRIGLGFEAEAVKAANREFKNKAGILAYALSGFKALLKIKPVSYRLELDGKPVAAEGMSLVIANSGNLGLPGVSLLPKIDIADGLLDVILIRTADLQKIFSKDGREERVAEHLKLFKHWQVKALTIPSLPKQALHYDGEVLSADALTVEVLPKALNVLC